MRDKESARKGEVVRILESNNGVYRAGQEYLVKSVTAKGYNTYIFIQTIPFDKARHVIGRNVEDKYNTRAFDGILYSSEEDELNRRDSWATSLKAGDLLEVRNTYYPWDIGNIIEVQKDHDNNDYEIRIVDPVCNHYTIAPNACCLHRKATEVKGLADKEDSEHYLYQFSLGPIRFANNKHTCPQFESKVYPGSALEIPEHYIIHGSTVIHEDNDIRIVRRAKGIYFVKFRTDIGYTMLGFKPKHLRQLSFQDISVNDMKVTMPPDGAIGDVVGSMGNHIDKVTRGYEGQILTKDDDSPAVWKAVAPCGELPIDGYRGYPLGVPGSGLGEGMLVRGGMDPSDYSFGMKTKKEDEKQIKVGNFYVPRI